MMKSDAQFSSTTLVVDDLDRSVAFYKAVCGLTEVARFTAQVGGRDVSEVLLNFRGKGPASFVLLKYLGNPAPVVGEAINVFATEDLVGFVERAIQHGAGMIDSPTFNSEYGVTYAFLKDQEGHLLGAYEQPAPAG